MATTEKIEIEIILDDGSIKKGFATITKEGEKAGAKIGKSFKNAVSFLKVGMAAAIVAVGFAIRKLGKDFLAFDKALAEIRTITQGLEIDTSKLAESLSLVAAEFGTSAEAQAKSYYQIISAGITTAARANETLIASNKLAIGGLTDTETAIDLLTSTINAYKTTNLSAAKAADVLFGTVKLGKTRIEALAGSLGQILPTASALGVSLEEVNGGIAQLTLTGLSTAEAVTQLNAVFTAVLKKQELAKGLGPEVAKAFELQALQAKGLSLFLKDLNKSLGGSETLLVKLLGRVEGAKAILALGADGFVGLKDKIDQLKGSAGAADKAFKIVASTAGSQFSIAFGKFNQFVIRLLASNTGAFTSFATTINSSATTLVLALETIGTKTQIFFGKLIKNYLETRIKLKQFGVDIRNSLNLDTSSQQMEIDTWKNQLEGVIPTLAALEQALIDAKSKNKIFDAEALLAEIEKLSNGLDGKLKPALKKIKKFDIGGALGSGIANGVQTAVTAIANGENAFAAFGKAALGVFGDLAIQLGQFFIINGIAIEAINAVSGAGAVIAGIALVALGTLLKGAGGGSSAPTAGGGVGGTAPSSDFTEPAEVVDKQAPTEVNIDITGQVVDPRGTALQIAELLRDIEDSNGAIMVNA